jgi:uncharacterized protein
MSGRRNNSRPLSTDHVIPPGTQIITLSDIKSAEGALLHRPGAVALIIEAPLRAAGRYRVRFSDGSVALVARRAFEPRNQRQKSLLALFRTAPHDLYEYVIYRCVIGSRAYRIEESDSDTTRYGIYLPPADKYWSLWGLPEQLERHDSHECYWELEKFLRLALRANPIALECLYTPLVEFAAPVAKELLAVRSAFLSRSVYQAYNDSAQSQFKTLAQSRRASGRIRWTQAMHVMRILLSGITILKEHHVPVQVTAHREKLLAIRRGQWNWQQLNAWRNQLQKEFDSALARTTLPDHPDVDRINSFLLKARRSVL